jgi:hypothetical protein
MRRQFCSLSGDRGVCNKKFGLKSPAEILAVIEAELEAERSRFLTCCRTAQRSNNQDNCVLWTSSLIAKT